MGYPWSDGFSLVANDLNPAIDHTTVKLHALSGYWETIRHLGATFNDVSGTASYTAFPNMSLVVNGVPSTTSWCLNMCFSIQSQTPGVTGNVQTYWNGAQWNSTYGATFAESASTSTSVNEDIWLVGCGTVQLYGKTTASGSIRTASLHFRRRPVYITPI